MGWKSRFLQILIKKPRSPKMCMWSAACGRPSVSPHNPITCRCLRCSPTPRLPLESSAQQLTLLSVCAGTVPAPAAGDAAGRRRVAVVLSEEGVATAVPLQSVVEAGLSQRVLFQENGQPVILEVLDQESESAPAQVSGAIGCPTWRN